MSTSPVSETEQAIPLETIPEPHIEELQEESRPLAGEVRPGEPTPEETARAVSNEPDPEFQVKVGPYKFLLSDLVSEDWLSYVSAFLPPLESAVKDMAPLVAVGVRSFAVLKNMTDSNLSALKAVAKGGDWVLLGDTLQALGVSPEDAMNADNLESLVKAAESNKPMEFLTAASMVFLKPLLEPALSGLRSISFSGFIIKLGGKLSELAYASVRSAVIRSDHAIGLEPGWRDILKKEIEMMDGFDQFNIVSKQFQLYQKGGKLRNFTDAILGMILPMIKKSMPSGTPTGSTT